MSYLSSVSSALIFPDGYLTGSVGSIISPAINSTAVASAALLQPIAALTLPKGRWLLSGVITLDATVGAETLTGNLGVAVDAVVVWRSQNVTAMDSLSVSLSTVIASDGTNVVTIPCTYTSSGGATYQAIASPLSSVSFIRIA
jgi:hypothetical protein